MRNPRAHLGWEELTTATGIPGMFPVKLSLSTERKAVLDRVVQKKKKKKNPEGNRLSMMGGGENNGNGSAHILIFQALCLEVFNSLPKATRSIIDMLIEKRSNIRNIILEI